MIYRVIVTARANADAIQAFRWKVDQSAQVAARWYAGLEKAIAKLSKFPERHPVAEDESERLGIPIRQLIYGKSPEPIASFFPLRKIQSFCITSATVHADRSIPKKISWLNSGRF